MNENTKWWFNLSKEERQRRTKLAHERYRAKSEKRAVEKAWRERPEVKAKMRATARAFHRSRWAHRTYLSAKLRAERMGVPFTITESDIVVPDICPVFGLPIRIGSKPGAAHGGSSNSPSLDRKIPALGYVPGNVCVISLRANALKNSATLEELEAIVRYCRS
jgi:hypothetical protein